MEARSERKDGIVIFYISGSTSSLLSAGSLTDTLKTTYREDLKSGSGFERFYLLHGSFKQYFSPSKKVTFSIGGEALIITNSDSISAQNNFFYNGIGIFVFSSQ